jgi:hypothetical protein
VEELRIRGAKKEISQAGKISERSKLIVADLANGVADYGERRQENTTEGRKGQYLLRILSEDNREMGRG